MNKSVIAVAIATGALLLSGCTSDDAGPGDDTVSTSASADATPVSAEDAWVKAADTEEDAGAEHSGTGTNGHDGVMTPVFGTLRNQSDSDLLLVGVSSAVSEQAELHETVPGPAGSASMQKREGGFTIPADGTLVLEPGGDHIMLMGLREPITTGQQVRVTLEFEDGGTTEIVVPGRSFEGGNEQYQGGE